MPRLSARGDWCAGVGGGEVTVNGRVIATNAGGAVWLDRFRVLYQQDAHLCTYDVRTGTITDIDPQGSFALAAGGGVYAAAFTDGVRVSNRPGERWPLHGIADVGPDGIVLIKTPDNRFLGRFISDVQSFGGGSWSGLEGFRPVCSPDIPNAVTLSGEIYGFRRAGPFCCYLHGGTARFVVQHLDRPVGKVLAVTTGAFRPDLVVLSDGRLRLIYAEQNEGEPSGSEQLFDVHQSELTAALLDVPPVDPPKPPEPPMPERDHGALVQQIASRLTHRKTLAYAWLLTKHVAWALRGEDCGLLQKGPGGENEVLEGGTWYSASRVCYPDGHIFKVVSDAGPDGANGPQWADNDTVAPSRYRPALNPVGGGVDPIDPPDPTEPEPVDLSAVWTAIRELQARPTFPRWVAIKSSRGRYLRDDWGTDAAQFDRDAAGDGETYELVPK